MKADSFFQLNLNAYIDMDNRGRVRARDKDQRWPISLDKKHNNFIAAVRKRGNASCSCHQGENKRRRKKQSEQEHTSFWKFLAVVLQNNGKEIYKKNVLHVAAKFLFYC